MINPTFASFKNSSQVPKNKDNRERTKEVQYKKLQPKTFQELKNSSETNKAFGNYQRKNAQVPLANMTASQYTPNTACRKKRYSHINVGGNKNIQGSGTKVRPEMPSKNFVTAKK